MAPVQSISTVASSIPNSHPLIIELAALRQQLSQFQKSSHQTAIQLQGARLELQLLKDENAVLRDGNASLRAEADILRANPAPPPTPPTSTALSELSLAHRRLSSKLDLTENALSAAQLELASAKQEIQRLLKERENDRAIINELRRIEEDREEEIAWEKGERRKAEEQKKLCDLALDEYKGLVHTLDPSAVPPETPSTKTPTILQDTPELSSPRSPSPLPTPSEPRSAVSTADSISNLLVGQRGVHRLFDDFTTTIAEKEKEVNALTSRIEEMEHTLATVTDQLAAETKQRIQAQEARDKVLRDDASAAKVVERYMTFTQKTHATVHLHLENLRARAAATQATLRNETAILKTNLQVERERAERLRLALDEASENSSREAIGRRREIGLRLKMLSLEEIRARKVEIWLDKVRRAREGVEGAVLEADILETLLDEGIEAISLDTGDQTPKDKQRSWRGLLGRNRAGSIGKATVDELRDKESSIARVLLAEQLVEALVKDLQIETDRRLELEKQRVEWLAKEAVKGRQPQEKGEDMTRATMFDLDHEESSSTLPIEAKDSSSATETDDQVVTAKASGEIEEIVKTEQGHVEKTILKIEEIATPPAIEMTPASESLRMIFQPLQERHSPLQKSLHGLSHSLASLRSSLPASAPSSPIIPTSIRSKKPLLPLLRYQPTSDPLLLNILDNIHEVIEDARVDVEIALADEDRVYRGFEALLGVGSVVQSSEVLRDAREFIDDKLGEGATGFKKLEKKVADLEHDLAILKSKLHEVNGMEITEVESEESEIQGEEEKQRKRKSKSIWANLPLRTVNLANSTPSLNLTPSFSSPNMFSSPINIDTSSFSPNGNGSGESPSSATDGRRGNSVFSNVSSVGRSFSASVIGAPRRVSGLAGGLYRPKQKKKDESGLGEEEKKLKDEENEVE